METYHLWDIVQRLKYVQIECDDALAVIERFDGPDTLFYIDPPYPRSVRSPSHTTEYTVELSLGDYVAEIEAHTALALLLHEVKGGVIVSSYHSDLYDTIYAEWDMVEIDVRTRAAQKATEVLWLSPRVQEMRMPLFQMVESEWSYVGL